ncbi:hypothetical protein ABK040_006473 [Willaertia magna]
MKFIVALLLLALLSVTLAVAKKDFLSDADIDALFDDILADSESSLSNGASLRATAAVNMRNGACTNAGVVLTIPAGATVTYTGSTKSGCGYTWYSVSYNGRSGYAASNWLSQTGGGSGGGSCDQSRYNYPLFKQCDSRWGGNRLGSSSTICKVGCLMTSVCSALNGRGKASYTPATFNSFLLNNGGYTGNLFIWGSVARFGFSYLGQTSDKATIRNWLCGNKVVILNVNGGGHWVLAKSYANGVYQVNDSGYNRSSYSEGEVVRAAGFNA